MTIVWVWASPEKILEMLSVPNNHEWKKVDPSKDIKDRMMQVTWYFPVIDEGAKSVTLLNDSLTPIAHIHPAIFNGKWTAKWIYSLNHLYTDVDDSYLDQWYWVALLWEYINAWFPLPPEEFTSSHKMIGLYKKFWYSVHSKIMYWDEELFEEEPSWEEIKKITKQWYIIKLILK